MFLLHILRRYSLKRYNHDINILGAGKYGKEIEDVAEQTNKYQTIQFLDGNLETKLAYFEGFVGVDAKLILRCLWR